MPVLALGASDCEALRDGWLGQPVNAWSSLAYVAAGAYVLWQGVPQGRTLAAALGAVGVGSFLYHGPMPAWAEPVHDWSIVALAAAVLAAWARRGFRRPPAVSFVIFGTAVTVNLLSRTGEPLCHPSSLFQGHAAWHILTALTIATWFAPWGGRSTFAATLAEPR
jgi:hypothetical protein